MESLCKKINQIVNISAKIMLTIMVITIFLQIAMRYVFQTPLMWSEELSRYTYAWFCFLGVALATYDKSHLKVSFLIEKFPKKMQYLLEIFSMILMIIFFVVVSWSAGLLPGIQGNIRAYSLGIPFWVLSISVIPGFVVSAFYTIVHLYKSLNWKGINR